MYSKTNDSLVSIIIPAYNAEETLGNTLTSVLKQDYKNIEVLIINDCSTDKTQEIAENFCSLHSGFYLFNQPNNQGVAAARNMGITLAKGDYLCFLDADDYWEGKKLTQQLAFMLENKIELSYMSYMRIQENTHKELSTVLPPAKLTFNDLLKSNYIGNLTAMIKKSTLGEIRFHKIGHEDYVFWLEILKKGVTAYLVPSENIKCFYLVRKNSLSASKLKTIHWQWKIYRTHLNLHFLKAFYFLFFYIIKGVVKRL